MKTMRCLLVVAAFLLPLTQAFKECPAGGAAQQTTDFMAYAENWQIFGIAIGLSVFTCIVAFMLHKLNCFGDSVKASDEADEMAVDIDDGAWCSDCCPCFKCCQANGFCEFYSLSVAVISLGLLGFAVGAGVNMAFDSCRDPIEQKSIARSELTDADSLPQWDVAKVATRLKDAASCEDVSVMQQEVQASDVTWDDAQPSPMTDAVLSPTLTVQYQGATREAKEIKGGGVTIVLKDDDHRDDVTATHGTMESCEDHEYTWTPATTSSYMVVPAANSAVTWTGIQFLNKNGDGVEGVRTRTVSELLPNGMVKLKAETYCSRSKADWLKLLTLPGKLWVNALKLFVAPLVVFMFLLMPFRVESYAQKGFRTIVLLSVTSFCAALQGLVWVNIFTPGYYIHLKKPVELRTATDVAFYASCPSYAGDVTVTTVSKAASAVAGAGSISELDSILGIFSKMIVKDILGAITGINILAVICFFCGLGIYLKKQGARADSRVWMTSTVNCSKGIMKAILGLVIVVIQFTPIGMFSLVAANLAKMDSAAYTSVLEGIGMYVVTQTVGQLFHMFVFYPIFSYLMTMGDTSFFSGWHYFYKVFQAPLTAFATSSSAATMPVTLAVCKDPDKGNISQQSADFTIPLGAAINMDGTGLGFPVMVCFVAQAYNQDLGFGQMFLVAIIAVVCSIGTAPIPNAGIVYITMLLAATNDPLLTHPEVIGTGMTLIIMMDWFVDRVETAQNVWSDCNIARIVDIWQKHGTPGCIACLPGCSKEFLAGDEESPKELKSLDDREMSTPVHIEQIDGTAT